MRRPARITAAAIVVAAVLLGLSLYLKLWGGVALVLVAAGGFAWYRTQVVRGQDGDAFFGDAGEDTRLTAFQGGPSEMPAERPAPAPPADGPRG